MPYSFTGRLEGWLCDECRDVLAGVIVRLYRPATGSDVTGLAVAAPKDSFAVLDDAAIAGKANRLIAETTTDAEGRYEFSLDEKSYDGGAFEVDVLIRGLPGVPKPPHAPVQISLTTIRPMWRQQERGWRAGWDYVVPSRWWCLTLQRLGLWVICGRVTVCETGTPLAGLTVKAFDVDWLQDDPLGQAVTDGAGHFRIVYTSAQFRKDILGLNIELVGGPDLYFRIEDASGTTLLAEPPSAGRAPGRENVDPCACVSLCVKVAETPPYKNPLFTHIGDVHILGDINAATGLTNAAVLGHGGPGYGFFGGIKLKGFCPKTAPSGAPDPMRYRFLFGPPGGGALTPVTAPMLVPVVVGSRLIQWKVSSNALQWTFQSIIIAGSGATPAVTPLPVGPGPWGAPPAHVLVPDADGWIAVEPTGLDDGFYGPLLRLDTGAIQAGGAAPGNGPGNAVAAPRSGIAVRIVFEAARIGGPVIFTNEAPRILVNNWNEVRLLDLAQFGGGGTPCSGIGGQIDIRYTADHELMAEWGLAMGSAAFSPPPPTPPSLPSGTTPRGGHGTEVVNVSGWEKCSYAVTLTTRRRLTDGENDDPARNITLTFCKD